jgi:hypothetical protein
VLQALASIYLLTFTAFELVAAAAARPREWMGRRFIPVVACLALAAGVSLLALWPYLQPYWQVHREQGAARLLRDVELFSASWKDYLSTPSRLHFNAWSHRWFTGAALFPGLAAMALAAVAVVRGIAVRLSRHDGGWIPGGLRPRRPSNPADTPAMAGGSRGDSGAACPRAAGCADLSHAVRGRLDPVRNDRLRSTRRRGRAPDAGRIRMVRQRQYMINSTRHFRPMLNGYSGFAPASFHEHIQALATFPAPAAIAALKAFGVTHAFRMSTATRRRSTIIETSRACARGVRRTHRA